MCAVALGWFRWSRLGTVPVTVKLAKIATCIAGLGAFVLNLFFAFVAGLNLVGMAVSRIRGY
jgi:hypothetical protein